MIEIKDITHDNKLFLESRRNIYPEWGTHLRIDDYIELENLLVQKLRENDLDYHVYALVTRNTDDESVKMGLEVVGSCDVISRPMYYAFDKYKAEHCIGKVYVRPKNRRNGLATSLVSQVTSFYDKKNEQVSLWSDIGDFYTRVGFQFPPEQWEMSKISRWIISNPHGKPSENVNFLNVQTTLSQIVTEHNRLLKRLTDYTQENFIANNGPFCHVIPDRGLYERLITRSIYTAEKLGRPVPNIFSARTTDGHGWVSWSFFFEEKVLRIMGIFGSANEIASLLVATSNLAAEFDCSVEIWESSIINLELDTGEIESAIVAYGLDAKLIESKEALPMYIGPGSWLRPGFYAWS